MSSVLDKLWMCTKADLLSASRSTRSMWLQCVALVAELAGFFYLARAVGSDFRPDGFDYFLFLLVGSGLYAMFVATIAEFVSRIREAQVSGMLEVILTTSTPAPLLLTLMVSTGVLREISKFLAYFVLGVLLFRASLGNINPFAAALMLALCILLGIALGLFAAALQIAVQKGGAVAWFIGSMAWLLTGTLFPVSALPGSLRKIGEILPLTAALDGMRAALLKNAGVVQIGRPTFLLLLWTALLLPLSLACLRYALRQARLKGALGLY